MNVMVNGQAQPLAGAATILDLLERLGFGGRPVVVELNQKALLPREHATTPLNEGDVIEVVQITAGG